MINESCGYTVAAGGFNTRNTHIQLALSLCVVN